MDFFAELDSPLGAELRFVSMQAREIVSEPFVFTVTAISARADLPFEQLLGEHLTVRLQADDDASAEPRFFDGCVEQVGLVGQHERWFEYRLVARPWLWFLSQTADCRVFQNKTVLKIVQDVFADHPGLAEVDVQCTDDYTPWVYCVQYRESDLSFVSRLLEQEGISYHFRHSRGKHVLVLSDGLVGHSKCVGCDPLAVRSAFGAHVVRVATAWDVQASQRMQPGAAMLQDHDFTRPRVDLRQSSRQPAAHALGDMEVYDYPGLYDQANDGQHFVRAQMEGHVRRRHLLSGRSDALRLACGGLVALEGSPRGDDGEYLVTATTIAFSQPPRESTTLVVQPTFDCEFEAQPTALPLRPARRTPKPFVQGPQTAVVVGPPGEEIHTDKYGRIKVQFHWDRYGKKDDKSSCWIRVSQPWAGQGWGGVSIPRIGQEVIVDFLEGDPDQPIVTGRVYNADQMPPYPLPAGAVVSGIKSKTHRGQGHNEMAMDDTPGKEMLRLHAQYDMSTTVLHDQTNTIKNDKTTGVDGTFTETVKKATTIKITEGAYSFDVAANKADFHVKGPVDEKYDTTQTTTVKDALKVSTTAGPITISADANSVLIKASTKIRLEVGASSLTMEADGKISLEGVNVIVNGTAMLTMKGGIVHSEAASEHQTKGAIVSSHGSATNTVSGGMVMLNP